MMNQYTCDSTNVRVIARKIALFRAIKINVFYKPLY